MKAAGILKEEITDITAIIIQENFIEKTTHLK